MLKKAIAVLFAVSSLQAFAGDTIDGQGEPLPSQEGAHEAEKPVIVTEDLVLKGARWLGKSTGFLCSASTAAKAPRPSSLEEIKVVFETATTDFTLDNGLIKASFVEGEKTCRYSALFFANNATKDLTLIESRAYSTDGESACEAGKTLLDSYFADTKYLYWGHPHHITVMIEEPNAAQVCGADATHVGVDFVLSGRL